MTRFNSASTHGINNFVKTQPAMLKNFYNTTDIFPYWVADMDFQVSPAISQALSRIVERGVYSYEFNENKVYLAIAKWNASRHGLVLNEQHFAQVPGVLSGLAMLLRLFTHEKDAVLINTPAYHQFANLIGKSKRKVVSSDLVLADLQGKEKHTIDFDALERDFIQENVKAMIFCNPHNPTGRVWRHEELAQVVEIAKRHNVLIISDEIHADIIYQGNAFTSLTSFDYDNIISLIGSPAKTFGMHSVSNGYIYTNNSELLNSIRNETSALYLEHGNALTSYATIAAYEQGAQWLDGMLDYLQESINWIEQYITANIPQLTMHKPEGTYQIWFDFSKLGFTEQQLKTVVFEQAKMGLTPGNWFGESNHNWMRMNIATSREQIIESFTLLANAINNFDASKVETPSCSGKSQSSCCC